jgi:hypothetical protein
LKSAPAVRVNALTIIDLLINPGDKVFYRPVSKEEFEEIQKMVDEGRFTAKILKSPSS